MKKLLLFLIIAVAASQVIQAQKTGIAANPAIPGKWAKVDLKKWGVESIELPDNLSAQSDDVTPQKNGDVTWNDASAKWNRAGKKPGPVIFDVSVDVTTWDVPFAKIAPDIKPELATPKYFLDLDLIGDIRSQQEKNSIVQEADYYDIDGVKGGRTILRDPGDKTRVIVIWQTFRYYKTKPQRVKVQVTAAKSERAAAIKIVDSLRLEKTAN